MAQRVINVGAVADDGKMDKLRVAFDKFNQNFTELYARLAINTNAGVARAAGVGSAAATSSSVVLFPPNISGTLATVAADFAGGQYWASGATQASFAAWMTAIGGTCTRASSATYLQGGVVKTATVNTPRFPTDLGGTAQGIRLTGAATNLLLQSNGFGTPPFASGGGTAAQNVTGPDGVASSGWTFTSGGNSNAYYQSVTTTGQNTVSCFVKAGTDTFAFLQCYDSGATLSAGTWFNLSTGAVASVNVPLGGTPAISQSAPSIIPLANGWFLISVVNSGVISYFKPGFSSTDANVIEATSGLTGFMHGAQLTQTAFPCDYIPTTTATVTQAADAFSFPFTQTTFSALAGTNNILDAASSFRTLGLDSDRLIYVSDSAHFATNNVIAPAITNVVNPHKTMLATNNTANWLTSDGLAPNTAAGSFAAHISMWLGSQGGGLGIGANYSQLAIWNALVASTSEMQRLTS